MWPFKSNIPTLEQITTENDGNTITVVLSKGAHKFSKEEVLDLRLTSDVFSPKIISSIDGTYRQNRDTGLFNRIHEELEKGNRAIQFITFLLFGGFLNLFVLYFLIYVYKGWNGLLLMVLSIALALICAICLYLFFCYLLKCIQVVKGKNHPELDLYFEDIVTISLNNCLIQFRMTDRDLDYFYDTKKDTTTFGFLINKRKKGSFEKVDNSRLEIFGFLFFLLIGFTALYFFWETPFWYWTFLEGVSEGNYKNIETSAFHQSHESMFQFSNYYLSNEISFLRAFFDGMVSNLILPFVAFGLVIVVIGFCALVMSIIFTFLCVYVIIIQIFAYLYLNSKLHHFLSNGEKFAAKLSVGIIISLLLALLSIYLGSIYLDAIIETVKPGGARFFFLFLPLSTYYLLQFFLRNTAFAKKSRNGVDQWSQNGLNVILFPLGLIGLQMFYDNGIEAKETETETETEA
jgi:hypothetical protein